MKKEALKVVFSFLGAYGKHGKKWYKSKTLWVNIVALIAVVIQTYTGFVLDPEAQLAVLTVINILLRLITKEPIVWGEEGNGNQKLDKEQNTDTAGVERSKDTSSELPETY